VGQDHLDQGLIAYNPPQEVIQEQEFDVVVRLQRGTTSTSAALTNVPGPGPVTIETVPVGSYMTAELKGAGFAIRPEGRQHFPLAEDQTVEFSWVVAPKTPGPHTLRLTLGAEVLEHDAVQRVYERTINVNVAPAPGLIESIRSWSGWSDAASGALAAGLVALVTWLLASQRKRKRANVGGDPRASVAPSRPGQLSAGRRKPGAARQASKPKGNSSATTTREKSKEEPEAPETD
jgi:hypothetical protein